MKHVIPSLAFMGTLVFAGPAMAQLVNGHNSIDNPLPESPIGTKAGGSPASLQAPGEGPAVAGALKNAEAAQNVHRRYIPDRREPSYRSDRDPDE